MAHIFNYLVDILRYIFLGHGFCVHSPRLDRTGNSVRARAFAEALSATFKFHIYEDHIVTHRVLKLLVGDDEVQGCTRIIQPPPLPTRVQSIGISTSQSKSTQKLFELSPIDPKSLDANQLDSIQVNFEAVRSIRV